MSIKGRKRGSSCQGVSGRVSQDVLADEHMINLTNRSFKSDKLHEFQEVLSRSSDNKQNSAEYWPKAQNEVQGGDEQFKK